MTKKVRIENADTSDWTVVVQVFNKSTDPEVSDQLVEEKVLGHPTDLAEFGIHSHRYLKIVELPADKKE